MLFSQDTAQIKKYKDSIQIAKDDTSRINALRKTGNLFSGINPDSALYYTRKALSLAEKIKWTKGIAQNCLNMGVYLSNTSQYDSALYYDNKALEAARGWKFKPAEVGGQPVASHWLLRFQFGQTKTDVVPTPVDR